MVRFMTGAALACALTVTAGSMTVAQEKTVMVGGAPMSRSKGIIDNAVNSKDDTTLVAAVKAAWLVDTLKGPGPFTVFAPTNAAFEALLKPENKTTLTKILTSLNDKVDGTVRSQGPAPATNSFILVNAAGTDLRREDRFEFETLRVGSATASDWPVARPPGAGGQSKRR